MSATAPLIVRDWPVGAYRCTFTVPSPKPGELPAPVIEWSPSIPSGLTPAEVEAYRAGRDDALAAMAQALGIRAAVVEVEP